MGCDRTTETKGETDKSYGLAFVSLDPFPMLDGRPSSIVTALEKLTRLGDSIRTLIYKKIEVRHFLCETLLQLLGKRDVARKFDVNAIGFHMFTPGAGVHRQGLPAFSQPKALDNGVRSITRPTPIRSQEANFSPGAHLSGCNQ